MDQRLNDLLHSVWQIKNVVDACFTLEQHQDVPLSSRHRFAVALAAISVLLQKLDFHPFSVLSIQKLGIQLQDLDFGIVSNTLSPSKTMSKPVEPTDVWVSRAHLCTAIEFAFRYRETEPSSRKFSNASIYVSLASETNYLKNLIAKGNVNYPKAIERWHRTFLERKVKSQLAQDVFDSRDQLIQKYQE